MTWTTVIYLYLYGCWFGYLWCFKRYAFRRFFETLVDIIRVALPPYGRRPVACHPAFSSPSTESIDEALKPLVAWTPEEREAFGLNELDRWIASTERALTPINQLEGQRASDLDDEVVELRSWDGTVIRTTRRSQATATPPAPFGTIQAGSITATRIYHTEIC
jgi:hypothetical protein